MGPHTRNFNRRKPLSRSTGPRKSWPSPRRKQETQRRRVERPRAADKVLSTAQESTTIAASIAAQRVASVQYVLLGLIGGLLLLGAGGFLAYRKLICAPMRKLLQHCNQLAAGDLSSRNNVSQPYELATLGQQLESIASEMRTVFGGVTQAAGQLSSASAALRSTADQQHGGAQSQLTAAQMLSAGADTIIDTVNTTDVAVQEVIVSAQTVQEQVDPGHRSHPEDEYADGCCPANYGNAGRDGSGHATGAV